jgi:uncharacterized protein YkwD
MKLIITLAILSGLLLALFLWLRPVVGSQGTPTQPDVRGRASNPVADGTLGGAVIAGPPASTIGPPMPRPGAAEIKQAGVERADEMEQEILALVNQERAKAGVGPLQLDPTLQVTARGHSDDMFVRGFFGHDDPDGLSAADRIAQAHRQMIGLTGENIWMGVNLDLADRKKVVAMIMDNWMRSSGHRANILKSDYTHLGVGVAVKGKEVRATQNFAAIRALTDRAVPAQVRDGQDLDLAAKPLSAGSPPDQFEFFSSDKGLAVGGTRAIAGATVKNVPAGVYKLRFLFPQSGGHVIYWGPRIEVK